MYGLGTIEWTAVEFEDVSPTPTPTPKARLAEVISVICAGEAVKSEELLSDSRLKRLAKPRQMAYALARDLTGLSYPALGRLFGRDHTSLLYGCRAVAKRETCEPEFAAKMAAYRAKVCELAAERISSTLPAYIGAISKRGPSLRWATRNKLPRAAELPA